MMAEQLVMITTRVPPDVVETLDHLASLLDASRSTVMREILSDLAPALIETATLVNEIRHGRGGPPTDGELIDSLERGMEAKIRKLRLQTEPE